MIETLLTITGTIIVALVAGIIALYQAKLNILSQARVNWIETLRETVSQYTAKLEDCAHAKGRLLYELQGSANEDLDIILEKFRPPYTSLSHELLKLQNKVLLYLNSNNPEHKKIEELLRQNSFLLHEINKDHHEQLRRNIEQIIRSSKEIFRTEWKRSKKIFTI